MPGLTEPPNWRERREGVGVKHDRGGVMGSQKGQYLWPGLWGRTAGLESRCVGDQLGSYGQEFISLHFHPVIKQAHMGCLLWARYSAGC